VSGRSTGAEDAGREDDIANLVSIQALEYRQLAQTECEDVSEKRIVGTTDKSLQHRGADSFAVLCGHVDVARTDMTLDDPSAASFVDDAERSAMLAAPKRLPVGLSSVPAREAEQHPSDEIEESRFPGLVFADDDVQARAEIGQ
jgi:hypothetical protein